MENGKNGEREVHTRHDDTGQTIARAQRLRGEHSGGGSLWGVARGGGEGRDPSRGVGLGLQAEGEGVGAPVHPEAGNERLPSHPLNNIDLFDTRLLAVI